MFSILIADDDTTFISAVRSALEGEGFCVLTAVNGPETIKAFTEHRPDLVILSVRLPGIDGIEVCRQIRALSGAPVFVMAAPGDPDDQVRALQSGADQYFSKPLPMREILARVRAIFRRQALDRPE